ncbi:hypothetical protein KIN20_004523 [Parelaphostrongylus tenuis]|uniref:Uncharacterized protein n=1 Tax=Parelaphostrongylus tenuis TaxID=148309 RepID=A0AAD5QJE4_PARTN|nr:hypothetical protein KIN20_004523 [Parelaphostrongylus tenuis]
MESKLLDLRMVMGWVKPLLVERKLDEENGAEPTHVHSVRLFATSHVQWKIRKKRLITNREMTVLECSHFFITGYLISFAGLKRAS